MSIVFGFRFEENEGAFWWPGLGLDRTVEEEEGAEGFWGLKGFGAAYFVRSFETDGWWWCRAGFF